MKKEIEQIWKELCEANTEISELEKARSKVDKLATMEKEKLEGHISKLNNYLEASKYDRTKLDSEFQA